MMVRVASRHLGVRFMRLAKLLDAKISHLEKIADLNPPLGHSNDPCIVVDRAKKRTRDEESLQEIKNVLREMRLMQKGDYGALALTDLSDGRRMKDFYRNTYRKTITHECSPNIIGGGRKRTVPLITHIEISPHTQFRMDIRGITIEEVEKAIRNYQLISLSNSRKEELASAFNAEETEKIVDNITEYAASQGISVFDNPYFNGKLKQALGLITDDEQKKKKIIQDLGYELEDIDTSKEEYAWLPGVLEKEIKIMKDREKKALDPSTLSTEMKKLKEKKQIKHTFEKLFVAFVPKTRDGKTVSLKTVFREGVSDKRINCP